MISPAKALVAILILLGLLSPAAAEVLRLDYEGFAVWLDCERRGTVKFRYNAQRDQGNVERPSTDQRAHPCKHLQFRLMGYPWIEPNKRTECFMGRGSASFG